MTASVPFTRDDFDQLVDLKVKLVLAEGERNAATAALQAANDTAAALRAQVAALKHCLADVLATIPNEFAKPKAQLVRMRARVLCATETEGKL